MEKFLTKEATSSLAMEHRNANNHKNFGNNIKVDVINIKYYTFSHNQIPIKNIYKKHPATLPLPPASV